MNLADVTRHLHGIPHTTPEKGAVLFETIRSKKYKKCLELGFACGVGSSYIAAALQENGAGHLLSVDTLNALKRVPRADELSARLGLSEWVTFKFEEMGYIWHLMEALQRNERYDFCFLDGAHTWDVDGFAYLLVERLLEPGGLIIFDDLDWTIESSPTMKHLDFPDKVRRTPAIRRIYELLVRRTPNIKAYEKDGWAYAEKVITLV